jgi:predicted N-acetyltransferase YhbS
MKISSQFLQISTLEARPELAEMANQLIEASFEYSSQHSFATDFYPLVNKENWKNCHIVIDTEKNKVIAFIGTLIKELSYQDISTPVCFMGGISVDKNYRGKGIFKFFIENILNRYEKFCSLFILWSGEPSLYIKAGFHLAGEQFETMCSGDHDLTNFSKNKLINLSSREIEQINHLHQEVICKNFLTIKRSHDDWDKIKNITSADVYLCKDEQGNIVEYFFANKGEDLKQIIYESSFLISEKYKKLEPFKIWSPHKTQEGSSSQFNCMIRLGSFVLFEKFIHSLSRNMINIIDYDTNKNLINFYFKGDTINIGINDFLCGTFGPGQFEELNHFLPKLFISGLDSI